MKAEKIWNLTEFTHEGDDLQFLPYASWWKNYAPEVHGSTLYENLKYLHDLGELEYEFGGRMPYSRKHYEYTPYEWFYDWFAGSKLPAHEVNLKVFKAIKCYQLKGLYNFPESMTIGEVKDQLLIPLVDKLLTSEPTLATTIFINRMSTELVSVECFIFCVKEINFEILDDFMFSFYVIRCTNKLIDSQDSNYWFYRFYSEIFLNSNVLSGTSGILSFSTKHYDEVARILMDFMKVTGCCFKDDNEALRYYRSWGGLFISTLNSGLMDWLSTLSGLYGFERFLQFGKVGGWSDPDFCLLLQQDIWDSR